MSLVNPERNSPTEWVQYVVEQNMRASVKASEADTSAPTGVRVIWLISIIRSLLLLQWGMFHVTKKRKRTSLTGRQGNRVLPRLMAMDDRNVIITNDKFFRLPPLNESGLLPTVVAHVITHHQRNKTRRWFRRIPSVILHPFI